ncbi:hypothetical protein ACFZBU_39840 [Embleya sp. NPDC008237]|uniref:hypothetical protein n=1 Tax=Embleya sp. NPDC008237 TaxID=3363978 RepID=UPI0036E33D46
MTHSQLDTIRSAVSTDLERKLLAEVDLLRSLTRRAEQDQHRIPEHGTPTRIAQDTPGAEEPDPAPGPAACEPARAPDQPYAITVDPDGSFRWFCNSCPAQGHGNDEDLARDVAQDHRDVEHSDSVTPDIEPSAAPHPLTADADAPAPGRHPAGTRSTPPAPSPRTGAASG